MEEARTSAFLACRLIREHSLKIATHRPSTAKPTAATGVEEGQGSAGFRRIRVRHPGPCRCCGKPIAEGEWALWCRGNGLRHPLCSP